MRTNAKRGVMRGLAALTLALAALSASAEVTLSMSAVREKTTVDAEGNTLIVREPVRQLRGGDALEIDIQYTNTDDEAVENVKIDNPVPDGTVYITGTATGIGTDVQVSLDNGQTWQTPSANDGIVTNLRWVVPRLEGHASGTVSFKLIAMSKDAQLP